VAAAARYPPGDAEVSLSFAFRVPLVVGRLSDQRLPGWSPCYAPGAWHYVQYFRVSNS